MLEVCFQQRNLIAQSCTGVNVYYLPHPIYYRVAVNSQYPSPCQWGINFKIKLIPSEGCNVEEYFLTMGNQNPKPSVFI